MATAIFGMKRLIILTLATFWYFWQPLPVWAWNDTGQIASLQLKIKN